MENPKKPSNNLLLIYKFSKVTGYKANTQKFSFHSIILKVKFRKKFKKTFTVASNKLLTILRVKFSDICKTYTCKTINTAEIKELNKC